MDKNLLKEIKPGLVLAPIDEKAWKLGATGITGEPISSGHWYLEGHVPDGEHQANPWLETFNCTGFGYTNRIEILWKRLRGVFRNFSDRWVGIVAGTRPPGNDPYKVAEAGRKKGLVDESDLPFDDSIKTIDEFYSGETLELKAKAEQFLIHEAVPYHDMVPSDPKSLMEMLKFSPLSVAVPAWFRRENGLYYFPEGMPPTHDTTLCDFEEGKHWQVFDSYPDEKGSYFKKIEWDAKFPYTSRRYWLGIPLGEQVRGLRGVVMYLVSLIGIELKKKVEQVKLIQEVKVEPLPIKPTVEDLAKAQKVYENVNVSLNNPLGLRESKFQNGYIIQKSTGKRLATFATYEEGWRAAIYQITIVCNGTSLAYTAAAKKLGLSSCADMTLKDYLETFAPRYENETEAYLKFVEARLKTNREVKMKTLLA